MTMRIVVGFGLFLLAAAGCSSTSSTSSAASTNTTPDAGANATTTTESSCPTGTAHKTVVIVGDSISDVGAGRDLDQQEPFYRTLLVENDDAKYADWKGRDLKTCSLIDPTTNVVKASVGGAIATKLPKLGASILLDQVKGLPATLPGPVLVVGTIGGNDALLGLTSAVLDEAKLPADRDAFIAGFGEALAELTKPGRFGEGVKVDVLMTNIYDPSGGTGSFQFTPGKVACPGLFGLWPDGKPTEPIVADWNLAMKNEVAKYPGVTLLDLHASFKDHNVNASTADNWFYRDCIHPNTAGHEHIRELFWTGILGLK